MNSLRERFDLHLRLTTFAITFIVTFALFNYSYGILRLGSEYLRYLHFILKVCDYNSYGEWRQVIINIYKNYEHWQKDGWLPVWIFFFFSLVVSYIYSFSNRKDKSKGPNTDKVTRGPRLVSPDELNKQIGEMISDEVGEIYEDLPKEKKASFDKAYQIKKFWGTPFACSNTNPQVLLPDYVFSRHISLNGATGVGKSTIIKHLLDHFNNTQTKSIILDINGEIYSELGKERDIILSPFDSRSHRWDFDKELSLGRKVNPSEYAKYIVPKGGEQNKFWWKGARTVLAEILEHFENSEKVWEAVSDPTRKFINKLGGVVYNIIGKIGSGQDAGIFGTLSTDLSFLKTLIKLNKSSSKDYFSIAQWAQDDTLSNVYILFSDKDFESFAPLIRIWLNLAVLGRFDAGNDNGLPKLNLMIDELGDLGHLDKLPSALARLRKYGGRVVLGLQSEGQLDSIYGKDDTKAMKGNIGTRFIFRSPEESEAKGLSKFLGRSEVVSVSQNTNEDKNGNKYNSVTESTSYKDIVLDSEIRELADGHFYLKCLNACPSKLRILKKKWTKKSGLHQEYSISDLTLDNQNLVPRGVEEKLTQKAVLARDSGKDMEFSI